MIEKPIIFIGTGRSGSTVISGAVLSHKDLGYPSNYQQKFPSLLGVNILKRLFDNKLWRVYTREGKHNLLKKLIFLPSEAYAMWQHITPSEINFSREFLLDTKATKKEVSKIHEYFSKMLELQEKKRLAFKITGPSRIGYLLSIFPDAQFVHVKRRLIPTVNSFLNVSFWQSRGKYRLWFVGAYSAEEKKWAEQNKNKPELLTAFQLGRINAITQMELKKYAPNVHKCDYENFINKPKNTIDSLLKFLNLNQDKACFKYLEKNPVFSSNKPDNEYFSYEDLEYIYQAYDMGNRY